jgi:hypothetical protein
MKPWNGRFSGVGVAAAIVLGTVLAGVFCDLGAAMLVLAACALLGAIAALWASLQAVSGNAPMTIDEAINLAGAGAADERKREILQTLKDLDLDFGVGKIEQDDYQAIVTRYRSEAKDLLRASDASSTAVRAKAAAYLALIQQPRQVRNLSCPSCQTANDAGAVFCNKCGSRLAMAAMEKTDGAN